MITKAVIAAAGKGTRMLHLTKNKPKHLLRVCEKPFLYYVLKNLKEAGIEEMIIVVGHKKEAMREFADAHKKDFNMTLVDQFEKFGDKYGTAVPIEAAKGLIGGESFISIYGDNLYSPEDITALRDNNGFNYIAVLKHPHPEKYGVAVTDGDGLLLKIVEKPKTFISDLINTGLYKFTPEIFEEVKRVTPSPRGEYELTSAIQSLAEKGKVRVVKIKNYWLDFGNPGDIIKVSKFLKNK